MLALSGATYAAHNVFNDIVPQAHRDGAQQTFTLIANAAFYQYELTGAPWPDALADTVSSARNAQALTVSGTTLRWEHGDFCFYAEIPTPVTAAEAAPCEEVTDG
jgi:hypothetical protein